MDAIETQVEIDQQWKEILHLLKLWIGTHGITTEDKWSMKP